MATIATARDPAAEILVGYAGPLTGDMELAGEQMQNGVELAVAELNAAGGVLGQMSCSASPTIIATPSRAWPRQRSSWPTAPPS